MTEEVSNALHHRCCDSSERTSFSSRLSKECLQILTDSASREDSKLKGVASGIIGVLKNEAQNRVQNNLSELSRNGTFSQSTNPYIHLLFERLSALGTNCGLNGDQEQRVVLGSSRLQWPRNTTPFVSTSISTSTDSFISTLSGRSSEPHSCLDSPIRDQVITEQSSRGIGKMQLSQVPLSNARTPPNDTLLTSQLPRSINGSPMPSTGQNSAHAGDVEAIAGGISKDDGFSCVMMGGATLPPHQNTGEEVLLSERKIIAEVHRLPMMVPVSVGDTESCQRQCCADEAVDKCSASANLCEQVSQQLDDVQQSMDRAGQSVRREQCTEAVQDHVSSEESVETKKWINRQTDNFQTANIGVDTVQVVQENNGTGEIGKMLPTSTKSCQSFTKRSLQGILVDDWPLEERLKEEAKVDSLGRYIGGKPPAARYDVHNPDNEERLMRDILQGWSCDDVLMSNAASANSVNTAGTGYPYDIYDRNNTDRLMRDLMTGDVDHPPWVYRYKEPGNSQLCNGQESTFCTVNSSAVKKPTVASGRLHHSPASYDLQRIATDGCGTFASSDQVKPQPQLVATGIKTKGEKDSSAASAPAFPHDSDFPESAPPVAITPISELSSPSPVKREDCDNSIKKQPRWAVHSFAGLKSRHAFDRAESTPTPLLRRLSSDAIQVRKGFCQAVKRRDFAFRRRRSLNEKELTQMADQVLLLANFKRTTGSSAACPVTLKRTSSLQYGILDQADGLANLTISERTVRKPHAYHRHIMSMLKLFSRINLVEGMSHNAMYLLTGGQSILERLKLFWHVERFVEWNSKTQYSHRRRHTFTYLGHIYDLETQDRPDLFRSRNVQSAGSSVCSPTSRDNFAEEQQLQTCHSDESSWSDEPLVRTDPTSFNSPAISPMLTRQLKLRLRIECMCRGNQHLLGTCTLLNSGRKVPPKRTDGLKLISACFAIPHPMKANGGEDSHFTLSGPGGFIGVFDGVGQWSDFGCDAQKFSRGLMRGCFEEVLRLRDARIAPAVEQPGDPIQEHYDTIAIANCARLDSYDQLHQPPREACAKHADFTRSCGHGLIRESLRLSPSNTVEPVYEVCLDGEPALRAMKVVETERRENRIQEALPKVLELEDADQPSKTCRNIISAGYNSAHGIWGACTALVAGMDTINGNKLGIANIGDSTILILRRNLNIGRMFTVIRRTREMQHRFNCPFQLARMPTNTDYVRLEEMGLSGLKNFIDDQYSMPKPSFVLGNDETEYSDPVAAATLYDCTVEEGDLLIAGTDGLFDNLFDHEIAMLASLCVSPYEEKYIKAAHAVYDASTGAVPHPNFPTPPTQHPDFGFATPPEAIAQALAEAAFHRSMDQRCVKTPFSRLSRRSCVNLGLRATGGKMDDITVVAAWVM